MPKTRGVVIAKLMIDLVRIAGEQSQIEYFGASAGDILLFAAIFLAAQQGRPMSSTKAAQYAGMPRASVIRKLNALRQKGLAAVLENGGWVFTARPPEHSQVLNAQIDKASRLIARAARDLSKMDGDAVAPRESEWLKNGQGDSQERGMNGK